jgi:hypothetical protein
MYAELHSSYGALRDTMAVRLSSQLVHSRAHGVLQQWHSEIPPSPDPLHIWQPNHCVLVDSALAMPRTGARGFLGSYRIGTYEVWATDVTEP